MLKQIEGFPSASLSSIFSILKPCSFNFETFFQIQKPPGPIQNRIQFHVDITHFFMLDIV